jgi:hypothetical protein
MAAPSPDRLLQQFWRVAAHYADVIRKRAETHGYSYAAHYGPHDLEARDWSSETAKPRVEIAKDLGITFEVVPRVAEKADGSGSRCCLPRI